MRPRDAGIAQLGDGDAVDSVVEHPAAKPVAQSVALFSVALNAAGVDLDGLAPVGRNGPRSRETEIVGAVDFRNGGRAIIVVYDPAVVVCVEVEFWSGVEDAPGTWPRQ